MKINRTHFIRKPFFIISLSFIIFSLLLLTGGYLYYDYQKEIILNEQYDYLKSLSDIQANQINEWIRGRFAQLEVLKSTPYLMEQIDAAALGKGGSPKVKNWFEDLQSYYKYDEIMLVENSKRIIYSTSSLKNKLDSADSLLCDNSAVSGTIIFSDADDNYPVRAIIKFYVPVSSSRDHTSISKYTLVFSADPQKNFNSMLNSNVDKSMTFEALLVKPYSGGTLYLNSTKGNNESGVKIDTSRKTLIEAGEIKSRKGFLEAIDYKNTNVIALMQQVPDTRWTLICKIDRAEFYAPVNRLGLVVTLTLLSVDLLFAIVLLLIWKNTIVENYKKIYKAETEKSIIENRFESLVNGVKDMAIFMLDKDGIITSWNEGAQIISGYTPDEIIGKHYSILYPGGEIDDKTPDNNLEYAAANGSFLGEGWRNRKDGSVFWASVLLNVLKDHNQNTYGYLKIIRDLTEKKKTEEEIRNSRDFYLKLFNDFPTPIWRSDLNGKVNYFNRAWLNYTGRSLPEEVNEGWLVDLHPDEKNSVLKVYNDAFGNKTNIMLEFRLKNKHNRYRWFINYGIPYFNADNEFAGYLGSCFDIEDRKNYEESINALLRIGEKLYSSLEVNQILDLLVTECLEIAGADGGYACVKQENEFVVNRYFNKDHWEYYEAHYLIDDNILARFTQTKDLLIISNNKDNKTAETDIISKYSVGQYIALPLYGSGGEFLGFFEIHFSDANKDLKKDILNLLKAVARNASISISKAMNYGQLRIAESQLRKSEAELRNLAAQIQYGREEERQRIAREIHDELGQLFTGINLSISLLTEQMEVNQPPSIVEIVEELYSVQKYVNKGIQSVRDISGNLRSYVLDHLGLIPALQEYCREIERMSGIKCNFKSDIDSINLNDEKSTALFRIVQEGITNVLRHADATFISVEVKVIDNSIEITIADNGKGIAENEMANTKSIGLLGMKERAIFINGQLLIEGAKDKGTIIHLTVPYK